MTPLQYVNKDLHTAQGWRKVHEAKKPDLQRISREQRILARKRLATAGMTPSMHEAPGLLEQGLDYSTEMIRNCIRQTTQLVRQRPLQLAAGAVLAGVIAGLLVRRR